MKIAFVTVDLFPGREMLMPWRNVLEIAAFLSIAGHEVDVLNRTVKYACDDIVYKGIQTKKMSRNIHQLCRFIAIEKYEVLVYPMPWRDALKNLNEFTNLKCRKIAYMPGGTYAFSNILMLCFQSGISSAMPFLLDYITPDWLYAMKLKKYHFDAFVGMTPMTTKNVRLAGFKKALTILPGKDDFESIIEDNSVLQKYHLENKKYLLYAGNSDFIRGTGLLVSTLNNFAERNPDAFVLFILRNDVDSDKERLLRKIRQLNLPDKLLVINEKTDKFQLKSLIINSRAVVLPFIIIPSEIPLTFIEVMGTGTPVITMRNSGTTEYLKEVILSGKSKRELLENMCRLWTDDVLCHQLREQSQEKNGNHPDWNDSGRAWNQLLTNHSL